MNYFKGEPGQYIIRYKNGKVVAHGVGLAFWYFKFNTSIATVPVVNQDVQFIFKETTKNYQEVSIQGQLTYRLDNPLEIASLLDYTIDPRTGIYRSDDSDKLSQRIINTIQASTRSGVNTLGLEEALVEVKTLGDDVLANIRKESDLSDMGVQIDNLYFTSVTATPEMRQALEADYREGLNKRADQAVYARRAAAVDEESKIKQSEMDTDVDLENRRRDLVEQQAQNNLTLAEADAKADEMKLNPYGNLAPQTLVGLALKEWAANAGDIGNLNITPDMLSQIVQWVGGKQQ